MHLILASASPRRAELLTAAGFTFEVAPADVDETPLTCEAPVAYALRVAREKARVAASRYAGSAILSADTVVVADGEMLGKPRDRSDAGRMLRQLSGTMHVVHTAVVLRANNKESSNVETTEVHFHVLDPAEIEWYVGTGEPDGKAGAYGIQGCAARFIDRIEGSWSNVVGLPVATVYRMLKDAGLT